MGRKVAFELLTLCDNMLPQRAFELGLVNRVVPDAGLLDAAMAMAEKLAGMESGIPDANQAHFPPRGGPGA